MSKATDSKTSPAQAAIELLRGRVLHVVSDDSERAAGHVPVSSGIVVASTRSNLLVGRLRSARPDLFLLAEPAACQRYQATADRPFYQASDGLFESSLDEILDAQRQSGASLAVMPTGYIAAQDSEALKAAVELANCIDRVDLILHLPCHYSWARPEESRQLIAAMRRSRHPVALSLEDRGDPLEHKGIPHGLRRVASEYPSLVLWRTDLAAFDALANGALAAAIGMLPSLRHLTAPGNRGTAINMKDKTPSVLVRGLLRFVRASHMQQEWFASAKPWTCDCGTCNGEAIDRFDGTGASRWEAHLHNIRQINAMRAEMLSASNGLEWWQNQLIDAEYAHQELASHTQTKVKVPSVIAAWLTPMQSVRR